MKNLHPNQMHRKEQTTLIVRYSEIHTRNKVVVTKTLHNGGLDDILLSFVIQRTVSHFHITGQLEKSVELNQKLTLV